MAAAALARAAVLALAVLSTGVLGDRDRWEWQSLGNMKMNTGDYITCRLSGLLNTHWMMATDEDHVIMVWPGEDDYYVKEWRRSFVISQLTGVNWNKCWNYGRGPAGGGTYVLGRARRHLDRKIYYHLLTCNCEHYVKFWTEQNYNINQSWSPASSYCSFFEKYVSSKRGSQESATGDQLEFVGLSQSSLERGVFYRRLVNNSIDY